MVSRISQRYDDISAFCKDCTPTAQRRYVEHPFDAYQRESATLTDLNLAFGDGSAATWLVPQLTDLSEFCGCKNKLQPHQLKEVAILLSRKYSYVKVSEFLLFFSKLKLGEYGTFYGSLDPMVITSAFLEFLDDRSAALTKIDEALREKKAEEENKIPVYTYEEWKKLQQAREQGTNILKPNR